ncbi:hypothetical protein [Peptoniphilus porci]|uniref:hypothetical protein n=1 Tax=Peptoniphilus porci TaxID=2652280 RepID=UPI0015BA5960|nr:hypothetical protein [Peptoniphilus porci]
MDILKMLGFVFVALGLALELPKILRDYREDRNLENFLELFGKIFMILAAIILAIGVFV